MTGTWDLRTRGQRRLYTPSGLLAVVLFEPGIPNGRPGWRVMTLADRWPTDLTELSEEEAQRIIADPDAFLMEKML